MRECLKGTVARWSPVKRDILLTKISQEFSQISITLNKLDEEVSKTKELQDLTQESGHRPVDHRLHLLGLGLMPSLPMI